MPSSPVTARAAAFLVAMCLPAAAQDAADRPRPEGMRQVTTHVGEMVADIGGDSEVEIDDSLRFEPFQHLSDMFLRDDVVFLMRHGPTDWSKLDEMGVDPTDCANQRVMIEEGMARMRDLGALMAVNEILPSRIVVSEWCRNQQTVDSMLEGITQIDPALADIPVETDAGLNLLLSLGGSENVDPLEARISAWDGDPERSGPLLIVSHYTNIEELTQFRVFEGEMLVLDPDRDNRVLGYLRLRSATPDVGHFADTLDSPLNQEALSLDMVERYYAALNASDADRMADLLAEDWRDYGPGPTNPARDTESFLEEFQEYTVGLSFPRFDVGEVHVAGDVVTVLGTMRGRHTGWLLGNPPTGRTVEIGAIAVHRVQDGAIVESWQMLDEATLRREISSD